MCNRYHKRVELVDVAQEAGLPTTGLSIAELRRSIESEILKGMYMYCALCTTTHTYTHTITT